MYEMRSYSWNGAGWEWNGDGWPVSRFDPAGDFSSYQDGEPICLKLFNEAGHEIERHCGVVRDGQFMLDD
jgi:hypothetical protein